MSLTQRFLAGLVYNVVSGFCLFFPIQLYVTGHWVWATCLLPSLWFISLIFCIEIGSILEEKYLTKEK